MLNDLDRVSHATWLIVRLDAPADLQVLAPNVGLRRGYDDLLFTRSIRDRFNRPRPAEMAVFVEGPNAATAFPDLHSPVIAVRRNCENKCNRGRHDYSAQDSNEECAYHFVSLHFPSSIIEPRCRADCLFGRD